MKLAMLDHIEVVADLRRLPRRERQAIRKMAAALRGKAR